MSIIVKTFNGIRSHWKKSILFTFGVGYGANYLKEKIEINDLMRVYCQEALKHGDTRTGILDTPRTITVILNPNANKGKAKKQFEKYCAPILHLAGISVNIILTQSEGHAKTILDKVHQTEAVVIAGGDGTVSEVITGMLRQGKSYPIGVLPLGRSNSLAKSLFPNDDLKSLIDATMAIVTQHTKKIDLMKIEVEDAKPIYAVDEIEWGVFRNAKANRDKYWYFGSLRNYATFLFTGGDFNAPCAAEVSYSEPCSGCTNCVSVEPYGWWRIWGKKTQLNENPQCKEVHEKSLTTTNLSLKTMNTELESDVPKLLMRVGPDKIDYLDFVKQGWSDGKEVVENVEARQVKIKPLKEEENELSIDNETFELKPIIVTLLPKAIPVYTKI